jgi:two-component system chemotaxis response regulator CheB
MADGVKIIVAATNHELIAAVKNSMDSKPYIESIVSVSKPNDAENKLTRTGINVLIFDLDEFPPNPGWSKALQNRFSLHVLYTSLSSGKYKMLPQTGNDVFLQKPAVFTPLTAWRFTASITDLLDTIVKRQRPPNMRELVKMVSATDKQKIVAIGSSTGGTNALEFLLKRLPADIPPMVVVQHMPSGFTKLFAERLNALYSQEIREAQSGDFLMRGRMLIAPADRHIRIVQQQGKLAVECYVGNRIHGVMPAADILFESVANVLGSNAVGVILTGMGNDGAKGLKQMKASGCKNIGQDEASCVVYGMPKAAKDIGAIDLEIPLDQIAEAILRLANSR